jgi:hypothetical protein
MKPWAQCFHSGGPTESLPTDVVLCLTRDLEHHNGHPVAKELDHQECLASQQSISLANAVAGSVLSTGKLLTACSAIHCVMRL